MFTGLIMLKIRYNFIWQNQYGKALKINFLTMFLLLQFLLNTKTTKQILTINGTLKTLLLSPFHYKVAKKNIYNPRYKVVLQVPLKNHNDCYLTVFKHMFYLNTYYTKQNLQSLTYVIKSKC